MRIHQTTNFHDEKETETQKEEISKDREEEQSENQEEEQPEEPPEEQSVNTIMGLVSGLAVATGTSMSAFGFTSSGIGAGSYAAATQAVIGNVSAGSTFATLQSFGALGGFAGMTVVGGVGIGVVGLGLALKNTRVRNPSHH